MLAIMLLMGCQKPEFDNEDDKPSSAEYAKQGGEPDGQTVLGPKLNVPYKKAVMQAAKDNLVNRGVVGASSINVRTTHQYIRFLPANESELDKLDQTNLILFDIPLDREVLTPGTHFHDPRIHDTLPTYQYTMVEPGFAYGDVQWEVLNNAYIPEDDSQINSDTTLVQELIKEAFTITGNQRFLETPKALFPSKWRPKGRVRVWDDVIESLVPVKGCQVRAWRFFKIGVGYTNSQGYYSANKEFRFKVWYAIKWERPGDFRICDGINLWTARYDGPNRRGDWNVDIGGSSSTYKNMRFATIHRAANRYYNEDRGGLDDPSLFLSWLMKLNITYKHSEGTGNFSGNWPSTFYDISHIRIFGKNDDGDFRPTQEVFSTTIHEIGHSSHYKKVGAFNFWQTSLQITESWADAIEWWLTRLEYNSQGINYEDFDVNDGSGDWKQRWTGSGEFNDTYTPLFIDLVDNLNQATTAIEPSFATLPPDQCPGDPWFDGANCLVGSPPTGTSAFIYNDNFYYTPIGCCECPLPGSWYDGVNCKVMDIPVYRIGFIYSNNWYLHPLGDPNRPYDVLKGWTMAQIEDQIIPNSYGLTSTRTAIKNNRPSGMTEKRVDAYLDFYFNL